MFSRVLIKVSYLNLPQSLDPHQQEPHLKSPFKEVSWFCFKAKCLNFVALVPIFELPTSSQNVSPIKNLIRNGCEGRFIFFLNKMIFMCCSEGKIRDLI